MKCKRCLTEIQMQDREGEGCIHCNKWQWVPLEELMPNDKNPRDMSKGEMKKLIRLIQEFGFRNPIIVNSHETRKNIIIAGHQRYKAVKQLGFKSIPVNYVPLTEDKEHILNIADNEVSGEWDDVKLYQLLKELSEKNLDLTLTGFDEPFIDEIMSQQSEYDKEKLLDVVPMLPVKPKTKHGEIYKLGDSYLRCGDSTKEDEVKLLMQSQLADMVFMDPPYGVSYRGDNNPNERSWGVMANDELRGDDLFKMLNDLFKICYMVTKKNAALYTCYASINHMIFEKALNDAGWIVKQQLIWEKGHVLGRSDFHWSHEPVLYCRKKEENTEWYGDRTQTTYIMNSNIEQLDKLTKEQLIEIISKVREQSDIFHIQKDATIEYLHATMKPVELIRRMIKNSSRPLQIVYDPCVGSGSTILACESTKRIAYAQEIDLKYCDVCLSRFRAYHGKDPIRLSDGKTWTQIQNEK